MRSENYWNLFKKRCQSFEDQVLIFKEKGYLVYHEDEISIYVHELIYLNSQAFNQMLAYFKNTSKKLIVECDINVNIDGKKDLVITMMSNQLSEDQFDLKKYINEVY